MYRAVPQLVMPTTDVHASFVEAMEEFRAEGRSGDHSSIGGHLRDYGDDWQDPTGFAEYVELLRADAQPQTPRREGYGPCTTLWWVDGSEWLGRLAIRHRLTPELREVGGHIGYDVRASARGLGHATAMLRDGLPIAAGLGIDRALITCDVGNIASRKVIAANRGVLADERNGKLRYWVPTSATSGT